MGQPRGTSTGLGLSLSRPSLHWVLCLPEIFRNGRLSLQLQGLGWVSCGFRQAQPDVFIVRFLQGLREFLLCRIALRSVRGFRDRVCFYLQFLRSQTRWTTKRKLGMRRAMWKKRAFCLTAPLTWTGGPWLSNRPRCAGCSSLCVGAGCVLAVSLSAVSTTVCGAEEPSLGSGGQRCAETDLLLDP